MDVLLMTHLLNLAMELFLKSESLEAIGLLLVESVGVEGIGGRWSCRGWWSGYEWKLSV
jgi:hypothetical protein